MIPKINLKTSYYLQAKILKTQYDRDKLIKFKDELDNYLENNREYILKEVEKLSGIKWNDEELDVWLFQGWAPSISSPILVNTYDFDLEFCFFNLVHELVHNNLIKLETKDQKGEWDHIELESIVNLITKTVLKKIFDDEKLNNLTFFAEFGGFYKYVWIRVNELEKEIDFSKETINQWAQNQKYITIQNE